MKTYEIVKRAGVLTLVIYDGEDEFHVAPVADKAEGERIIADYAEHGVEVMKA